MTNQLCYSFFLDAHNIAEMNFLRYLVIPEMKIGLDTEIMRARLRFGAGCRL